MEQTLLALLLVLAAAWFGGNVISRFGYPAVLGELLVGILLGPAVLQLLGDGTWLSASLGIDGSYKQLLIIGDLGVLLMMLYIGMEIDPKELGKASWTGFLASIGGFVTPFGLGLLAMVLFGYGVVAGIFVGIALGVTSLAVNSRIVLDLRILDTRVAHVMLAGALIADTLCLLIFAGLVPFARDAQLDLTGVQILAVKAAAFFVGVGLLGLWVFPWAAKLLRRKGINSIGVYFILLIMIALLFGELAHLAGLHAILGTFAAGLFLREGMLDPKSTHQLNELVRLVSVAFLAPVFFVLTGFEVTFDVFITHPWELAAVLGAAMIGKVVGTALFYLPTGHGWREGVVIGAGMNGRGAVEIILAKIGLGLGLITAPIFSILVFMAIITTATVPFLLKLGTSWLRKRGELVRSADKRNGIIVIGATPLARALARLLRESQPVTVIDSNPARAQRARDDGTNAVDGNALENRVMTEAKAPETGRVICMTTNAEINVLAARNARETFLVPNLSVISLESGSGDAEALQHLEATTLFGRSINLGAWDQWFESGAAVLERVAMPGRNVSDLVKPENGTRAALPLAVERTLENGKKSVMPYVGGFEFMEGDQLVLAKVRAEGAVARDRMDELLASCPILDIPDTMDAAAFFQRVSEALAPVAGVTREEVEAGLQERERLGSTVLTQGLAVPHMLLPGSRKFALVVARCLPGIRFGEDEDAKAVHSIFVLAATQDERNFHLKALSAVAQIWQSGDFEASWKKAANETELRELLLKARRLRV